MAQLTTAACRRVALSSPSITRMDVAGSSWTIRILSRLENGCSRRRWERNASSAAAGCGGAWFPFKRIRQHPTWVSAADPRVPAVL